MSWARHCSALVLIAAATALCSGCSTSPPISVSVSPSAPQGVDAGETLALMAIVTPDPSAQNVTWTLNGPGTLTTLAGASVTYLAPTSVQAVTQATVTATSVSDHTKSASVQITVNPLPQIPIQSIRNGTVGVAYNQTIGLTGGTAPFQWSVYDGPIETGHNVGGSIPNGLTLDTETGTVSGTPTAAGTWYFEATVT